MKITHPLYEAEIVTSGCAVELLINKVFSFCNFEEGGMSIDWPINENILQSGVQEFELRVMPFKGQATISPKAEAKINIYVREAIYEYIPQELIYEGKKNDFKSNPQPLFLLKDTFSASVGYKLIGWKTSLDLRNEPHDKLMNELISWNQKLLQIYRNGDRPAYLAAYKARLAEFDQYYYSTPEEIAASGENIFHSKFKDLIALPDERYELCFYDEGKLASLRIPYYPPGFVFEPKIKDEDSLGITLTTLFHRRNKNEALEIIR